MEEFEALAGQVAKNAQLIERVLAQIARGPLVPPDSAAAAGSAAGGSSGGGEGGAGTGSAAAAAPPDMPEFNENYEVRCVVCEGLALTSAFASASSSAA